MAGLSFGVGGGAGFGPVRTAPSPSYGSAESYGAGVSSGAFGPGLTSSGKPGLISASHPVGLMFWIGVGSIVALVWVRSTLPN